MPLEDSSYMPHGHICPLRPSALSDHASVVLSIRRTMATIHIKPHLDLVGKNPSNPIWFDVSMVSYLTSICNSTQSVNSVTFS